MSQHSPLGIALSVCTAVCWSIVGVATQELGSTSPFLLSAARLLLVGPIAIVLSFAVDRRSPFTADVVRRLGYFLAARVVVLASQDVTRVLAQHRLPLGDAAAIMYSAPAFVTIIARVTLKEPLTAIKAIGISMTLVGCTLVARPQFLFANLDASEEDRERVVGILFATATAIAFACGSVQLRHFRDESAYLHNAYGGLGSSGALIAVTFVSSGGALSPMWWNERQLLALFVVVTLGAALQYSATFAYKYEQAGVCAIAESSNSVFALLWQTFWFGETPMLSSIIGAALVIGSVALFATDRIGCSKKKQSSGAVVDSKATLTSNFASKT